MCFVGKDMRDVRTRYAYKKVLLELELLGEATAYDIMSRLARKNKMLSNMLTTGQVGDFLRIAAKSDVACPDLRIVDVERERTSKGHYVYQILR